MIITKIILDKYLNRLTYETVFFVRSWILNELSGLEKTIFLLKFLDGKKSITNDSKVFIGSTYHSIFVIIPFVII